MSTEDTTYNNVETALNAGRLLAAPIQSDLQPDILLYTLPEGHHVQTVDIEATAANPRRKRGKARPATVHSLTDYVKRHLTEGTTIWVHPTAGKIEAILDDHEAYKVDRSIIEDAPLFEEGLPGHGTHRAVLQLLTTPEWDFWLGSDSQKFGQEDFAEHIEDGAKEIVEPASAELLEIASSFRATNNATFRKASNLQSGEAQFQYDETINATAGKSGELVIPQTFKLAIAPFVGEPKYSVTARLRYRLSGGSLTLSYKLDRPHDVVRDALDKVAERLAQEFDNVFIGEPRA